MLTYFVVGDQRPSVSFVFADKDLGDFDSITMRLHRPDGSTVDVDATLDDAANGRGHFVWPSGALVEGVSAMDLVFVEGGEPFTLPAEEPITVVVRARGMAGIRPTGLVESGPDITISASGTTLQIASVIREQRVPHYDTAAEIEALSLNDGTFAYAEDTGAFYQRTNGAWEIVATQSYVDDAIDSLDATQVDVTRTIIAGAGLTGGGDLSANRTISVVANADGSIVVNSDDVQIGVLATDAQHGARGGGTQHSAATGSVAGFLSAADKTKLDGIAAVAAALSASAPSDVGTAASAGSGSTAAPYDHVHKLSAAASRNARYQAELVLNVVDYGGDPTGLSDSTSAWNNFFAALARQGSSYGRHSRGVAPPGTYKILDEVTAPELLGATFDIGALWGVKLLWQGTGSNKTVLTLRNCRDIDFAGIVVDVDTAGGVSAPNYLVAMLTDTNHGSGVSTQNMMRRVMALCQGKADVGFYWNEAAGSADSGNDYHKMSHCVVYGAVTASYKLEEGQSKGVIFDQCFSYNAKRALWTPNQGGAFNWVGGFVAGHTDSAFYLDNVIDPISIIEAGGEDNNRFVWFYTGDTGNGCPVEIRGCRIAANGLNADRRIMILGPAGPYRLIGNQIGTHGYAVPRIKLLNSNPSSLLLEDNSFEAVDSVSNDPLEIDYPLVAHVTRHRNRYRNSSNQPVFRTDEDREVLGPSGAAPVTDNAIMRWDGTTGTAAQNSLATIDDSGNIGLAALATIDGRDPSVDGAALDARLPTTNEKAALAGTGTPSVSNKYVTSDDARIPTTDEKAALAGTSGTAPSVSNKFVDAGDTRLSDSRAPNGTATGDLAGSYPSPTVAAIHETGANTKLTVGSVPDGYLLKRSGTTLIGFDGSSLVAGPASATDNALARFDATTGKLIQNSAAILDDSANLTGVNTVTTTTFLQAGSYVQAADGSKFKWASGQNIQRYANNYFRFENDDNTRAHMYKLESASIASLRTTNDGGYISLNAANFLGQASGAAFTLDQTAGYIQAWGGASYDTTLKRAAANFWESGSASGTAGGGFQFTEISDPSAPAANKGMLYAKDDGSGNTILVARFNGNSGLIFTLGGEDGMHRWNSVAEQTTVGSAGVASAPPANPTKYLKIKDSAGTTLVIPAYAAS